MKKEQNIHIAESLGGDWTVQRWTGPATKRYGSFRVRLHAEAFGRAIAHRYRVDLIVHTSKGVKNRYGAPDLTYPAII